jgi:hypothetical protein
MGRWTHDSRLKRSTRSHVHPYRATSVKRSPVARRSQWPRRRSFRRRGFRPETEILSLRLIELLARVERYVPEKRSNIPMRLTIKLLFDWSTLTGKARLDQGMNPYTAMDNLSSIPCPFCHTLINLNEPVYVNHKERIAVDQAHIESLAHGGSTERHNISLSCIPCNRAAKDMHMIEFMIRNNLPGLATFEAKDPEMVNKYRQLVRETVRAQRVIRKKLPHGTVSPQTWRRLNQALAAPLELRQEIIRAIDEL